jgi:transcriptional/translational regulatory protein YebC/TACO1
MFQKKGLIEVISEDEESVMMAALDAGAEDIEEVDGGFRVFTEPDVFEGCLKALQKEGFELGVSDIKMIPDTTVKITGDDLTKFDKLISLLEDCDDVQQVDHNAEYTES